jgi:D12 class N6 adenine-specific DNA methyltransferase
MTLVNVDKAPFPWFGGKRDAAHIVWAALGDPPHYVEPFAGSMAVLLNRPHPANRTYYSETVNDLDGLLVNFWRALRLSPQATAEAASWPVAEFDKHARSCRLLAWRETEMPALLAGDPDAHDPVMAGWWAWAVSVQIGAWGQGGPWWPDATGRLRKWKQLPLLDGTDGVPAPGVPADLPHLGDDGRGVNRPQARAPGVPGNRPHLSDNGQGVHHAGTRAPGVPADLPHLANNGQGANHGNLRQPEPDGDPVTMPEIVRWFHHLAARLRHVRILNGDWSRTVTTGAAHTLPVRQGKGPVGIFLDPPYGDIGRQSLYGRHEDFDVAAQVRAWALTVADDPRWRIVIAGYDDEGADLLAAGWTEVEWFTQGFLRGGMGNVGGTGNHQQKRERLWLSPHCTHPDDSNPATLW